MRKILLLLIFLVSSDLAFSQQYKKMIESGEFTVMEIQKEAKKYFKELTKDKEDNYKFYQRWEYNALRLMDEDGFLVSDHEVVKAIDRYQAASNTINENKTLVSDDYWEELGPTEWNALGGYNPGVGRINALAVDAKNQEHIIAASPSGGVWNTQDGGKNWVALADQFSTMRMSSLAMDQKDTKIYYCGTTSGIIFKSIDKGKSWSQLKVAPYGTVFKLLIHPDNSNIVFASVSGNGVFKSLNAGTTWKKVSSETYIYDIEFKPNDPSVLYISGRSVRKSNDGGETFELVTGFSNGVKMIGVSADDPKRVYILEEKSGGFGDLYMSNNSGQTFAKVSYIQKKNILGRDPNGVVQGGQAPRDMDIAVSPTNANEIHVAGILTWRSVNGGKSFTCTSMWVYKTSRSMNIGYCHADIDILEYVGENLYVGSDGGIFVAEDTELLTKDYFRDLSKGLGVRECYRFGITQTDPVIITVGAQDNGHSFKDVDDRWYDWMGADGMESIVDINNSKILYGAIQNGVMYKSTNGGKNYSSVNKPTTDGGLWVNPFEQEPSTGDLITGFRGIYRTSNKGLQWKKISQGFISNVKIIKIAPSKPTTMYAVVNRTMYKTTTGEGVWIDIDGLPSKTINSIAIHPKDHNKIACIFNSNQSDKVKISNDGGATWIDAGDGLPDVSPTCAVWYNNGKNGLFLGTRSGIYFKDDGTKKWIPYSNSLPNVLINEMDINYRDEQVYAATYGRGVWRSGLPQGGSSVMEELSKNIKVYPTIVKDKLNISTNLTDMANVEVYDIKGSKLFFTKNVNLSNYNINFSDFQNGTYFVRMIIGKNVVTKKVIVSK